ncbi:hypothetical protein Goklo_007312 [Gossypium klotzschianum]|uniref:Uncharacterized protein n=1 Tax=Gossypium klotzschianum TaxID=34286 RepID=A0A7J8W7T1_9ROSI|nr:hypothetical protein [Gossypium klotzschianum]
MTRMKYDLDDDFAKETRCEDRDNLGQPSGKYTRTPVLHKSRATKCASYCLQGEIELSQKWLLEEGCNSVDIDLGFSSSHCTSQANLPSVGSWLWAEDPIGAFPACPISRFRKTSVPLGLFDAGQYREIGFLDLSSVQGRINGDNKRKPKSPPANCEHKEDEFKEVKDGTLEKKGSLGVETSSSVKIHEKGESKG